MAAKRSCSNRKSRQPQGWRRWPLAFLGALLLATASGPAAEDLAGVRERGVLRHLGLPYGNFVTGSGDGLEAELLRLFAEYLGVRYQFTPSPGTFAGLMGSLTGQRIETHDGDDVVTGPAPRTGDVGASGITIWSRRERFVAFSTPTFPTQVWLVARADSVMTPIAPGGDPGKDIDAVRRQLKGQSVLGKPRTTLDPALYALAEAGATVRQFDGNVNELVPAIIQGAADCATLDVPTALIDLQKWAGRVKVIGPVSPPQAMGAVFAKDTPELRLAFNAFVERCRKDGTYWRLMHKYFPAILDWRRDFFRDCLVPPEANGAAGQGVTPP